MSYTNEDADSIKQAIGSVDLLDCEHDKIRTISCCEHKRSSSLTVNQLVMVLYTGAERRKDVRANLKR